MLQQDDDNNFSFFIFNFKFERSEHDSLYFSLHLLDFFGDFFYF